MKDHDANRQPGPFRFMKVDSEFAGLLVAVGFLVMGFVSMPLATGFALGAITLRVVVALLLRFTPKKAPAKSLRKSQERGLLFTPLRRRMDVIRLKEGRQWKAVAPATNFM